MSRCSFESYIGDMPYIFVSYAHADSKVVFPILEELNRCGFRVWYDGGIEPGKRWGREIAGKIAKCGVFLSVISQNYIESDNCRNELYFACDKKKKGFVIHIDDCAVPDEIALLISSVQAIYKNKYVTKEAFLEELCNAEELYRCNEDYKPREGDDEEDRGSRLKRYRKKRSVKNILISVVAVVVAVYVVFSLVNTIWYNTYYQDYGFVGEEVVSKDKAVSRLLDYCAEICVENKTSCQVLFGDNYQNPNHVCFMFTYENATVAKKATAEMKTAIDQSGMGSAITPANPTYAAYIICIDLDLEFKGYLYINQEGSICVAP